jgi:adenylate kinase family enzyme
LESPQPLPDYEITDIVLVAPNLAGKETLARGLGACRKNVCTVEMSSVIGWAQLHHPHFFHGEGNPSDLGGRYSDGCALKCLRAYLGAIDLWGKKIIWDGAVRSVQQAHDLYLIIKAHRTKRKIVVLDMRIVWETVQVRAGKRTKDRIDENLLPRKDDKIDIAQIRFNDADAEQDNILRQLSEFTPHVHRIDANGTARQTLLCAIDVLNWKRFAIDSGLMDP